jgi:hypothetical protein
MKKREVKSQKQEQNGHKKGARNKRGGAAPEIPPGQIEIM